MVRGTTVVDVASTVRDEFEIGVVVPIADCPFPRTVLEFIAYPEATILGRGPSVSKLTPLQELLTCAATSTFR